MISVVYLQDRDLDEYEDYLNYLQQAGFVEGEVEHLVLDPLQSVNGLRAIRFRVRYRRGATLPEIWGFSSHGPRHFYRGENCTR